MFVKAMKKEIKVEAAHQAGHAIAYLAAGIKFDYVSIDQSKSRTEGYVKHITEPSDKLRVADIMNLEKFNALFQRDVINMAGKEAEFMVIPEDIEPPAGVEPYPFFNREEEDLEISYRYNDYAAHYTNELIEREWEKIEAIAKALTAKETLSYFEILSIINQN